MSDISTVLPPSGSPPPMDPGRKRKRSNLMLLNFLDGATYFSTLGGALLMFALLAVLTVAVFRGAAPAMRSYGLGFLTNSTWQPNTTDASPTPQIGALPVMYGTL